jgi:hypothetical protein
MYVFLSEFSILFEIHINFRRGQIYLSDSRLTLRISGLSFDRTSRHRASRSRGQRLVGRRFFRRFHFCRAELALPPDGDRAGDGDGRKRSGDRADEKGQRKAAQNFAADAQASASKAAANWKTLKTATQ